jgi:hypothetical protein
MAKKGLLGKIKSALTSDSSKEDDEVKESSNKPTIVVGKKPMVGSFSEMLAMRRENAKQKMRGKA